MFNYNERSFLIFIKKYWYQILIFSTALIYFLTGSLSGESFDDASVAQHGQFFYDMGINPLIYSVQGAYDTWIAIGGYSIAIFLQALGFSNIITMQTAVKFPFIIFSFFTTFFMYKLARGLNVPDNEAKIVSLVFLTEPVLYYVAAIHGIPLVISMFFLISSIAFLQNGKNSISAVLYGMACSTYLYPIFAIPFLFRFVWNRNGLKSAASFTSLVVVFFLIGILPSLLLYKLSGIPLSTGSSAVVVTSFFSPNFLPLYSFFDFLYLIPSNGFIYSSLLNILFLSTMGVSSILISVIPRTGFFKLENLLLFFTLQALLFILFNPANAPQYLYAVAPLLLLCSIIFNNEALMILLSFATLFDFLTLVTWNPTALLGLFFADTNPSLLSFTQTFPFHLVFYLSLIYGSIILVMTLVVAYKIFSNLIPSSYRKIGSKVANHTTFYVNMNSRIRYNFTGIVLITILVFILVSPGFSNLPNNYLQINKINEQIVSPTVSETTNGQIYSFKAPYLSIVESKYYSYYNGTISLSSYNPAIYEWFFSNDTFSVNTSETLSETINLPFEVSNLSIKFASYGNISNPLYLSVTGFDQHLDNLTPTSTTYIGVYNVELIYYNISGVHNPGNYTFTISSSSTHPTQMMGTINNVQSFIKKYTKYVANLSINGRLFNGSSLALLVTGNPVFIIGNTTLQVIKTGEDYSLNVTNKLISSPILMSINGTFNCPMILTLYLPSSRYIDLWHNNLPDLALGAFMLSTTLYCLVYLVRKLK